MANRQRSRRPKLKGVMVSWEPWTFWHRFKGGIIPPAERRHQLLGLGAHGLEFATTDPPENGARVLLNVFFADEPDPFVARGVVIWTRSREGRRGIRVGIEFRACPKSLGARIKQLTAVGV